MLSGIMIATWAVTDMEGRAELELGELEAWGTLQ